MGLRMRRSFPGYFRPTEEEFAALWKQAVFALDASVLLDLYRSSAQTQEAFLDLLIRIRSRLWVPYQACKEYLSNRLTVISSLGNSYKQVSELCTDQLSRFEGTLSQFRKHPLMNVDDLVKGFREAAEHAAKIVSQAQAYHPDYSVIDPILLKLEKLLNGRIGDPIAQKELENLIKVAEQRYSKKIPPGYKDDKKDEAHKFGDYLIWHEMIKHATSNKKPIVFVTADLKEDWWQIHEGKTIGPRPELIQEMYQLTGMAFYMYTPSHFMTHASTHLFLKDQMTGINKAASELSDIQRENILSSATSSRDTREDENAVPQPDSEGNRSWLPLLQDLLQHAQRAEARSDQNATESSKGQSSSASLSDSKTTDEKE